jgi:hypothetical protein
MAGVGSPNLPRPTIPSITYSDNGKLLGPSQNFGAASQFSSSFWPQFQQYLCQRMAPKTAEDRIRYAKQFATVLQTGNATALLQVPPNKRIHIMKALSSLARYTGTQSDWLAIRQQYGLQWSTGTEKLDAFTRFFDDSKDLDTMIGWLKEAIQVIPPNYANFFLFCTLTGLRCTEAIASVKLIKDPVSFKRYYDPDGGVLRHYAFPDIFIRRTKAVYISVVDDEIIAIVQGIDKTPTLNAMKMISRRTCLSMRVKYCRKIYASWLHRCGESSDLIDMLQGRIGKNIFLKHYITPTADYKDRVLTALRSLEERLLKHS